jgi:hypothetical protein
MKKGPSVHSTELSYNLTTLLPHTSSSQIHFLHNNTTKPPFPQMIRSSTPTGHRSIGQRSTEYRSTKQCEHPLSLDDEISRRYGDNLRPVIQLFQNICTPMEYVKLWLIDGPSSVTSD